MQMHLQRILALRGAWRLALVALLLSISGLALSPAPPPSLDSGWDKLNHLAAFAALALAASFSMAASLRHAGLAALALLAYGGLIELLQARMPPRQGEWADLLADALGILLGLVVAALLRRLASRPH